jgi:hypothetical protein
MTDEKKQVSVTQQQVLVIPDLVLSLMPNGRVKCTGVRKQGQPGEYQFEGTRHTLTTEEFDALCRHLAPPHEMPLTQFPIAKDLVQSHNDKSVLRDLLSTVSKTLVGLGMSSSFPRSVDILRAAIGMMHPIWLSCQSTGLTETNSEKIVAILLDDLHIIHHRMHDEWLSPEVANASKAFEWSNVNLVNGAWFSTRYPLWLAFVERLLLLVDLISEDATLHDPRHDLWTEVAEVAGAWILSCCTLFGQHTVLPVMKQLLRQRLESAPDVSQYKGGTVFLFNLLVGQACALIKSATLDKAECQELATAITNSTILGPRAILHNGTLPALRAFHPITFVPRSERATTNKGDKTKARCDLTQQGERKVPECVATAPNLEVLDMEVDLDRRQLLPQPRPIRRFRVRVRESVVLAREAARCGVKRSALDAVLSDPLPVAARTRLKLDL